jgi:hypothetical protein
MSKAVGQLEASELELRSAIARLERLAAMPDGPFATMAGEVLRVARPLHAIVGTLLELARRYHRWLP